MSCAPRLVRSLINEGRRQGCTASRRHSVLIGAGVYHGRGHFTGGVAENRKARQTIVETIEAGLVLLAVR